MAYLLALLPLPCAFLVESLPLRIMCVFIALLIVFFVRESRVSRNRPYEAQIRFKPENPEDEDAYEFFMDRFWQTQMAERREVSGDPIYLDSVDPNEIKKRPINPAHHNDGPKIDISTIDVTVIKAEIARQMAEEQGTMLSLDMIDAEAIRAEIAFEIAQERALQSYDSADAISLDSVDVNAIKATPLELDNAIRRLQQRTMQGARTEMQPFNFRKFRTRGVEINPEPVRIERRQRQIPVPFDRRHSSQYPHDNEEFQMPNFQNSHSSEASSPIPFNTNQGMRGRGDGRSIDISQYRIKPVTPPQNNYNNDAFMANSTNNQNFDPKFDSRYNRQQDEMYYQENSMRSYDERSEQYAQTQRLQAQQQRIQQVQNIQAQNMQAKAAQMQRTREAQIQDQPEQMQRSPEQRQRPMQIQGQAEQVQRQRPMQMQGQTEQVQKTRLSQIQRQPEQMQRAHAEQIHVNMQRLQAAAQMQTGQTAQQQRAEAEQRAQLQAQRQRVMQSESTFQAMPENMQRAHAMRMEQLRRQREHDMQRQLAYQTETIPFAKPVERRQVQTATNYDGRTSVRRIQDVPVTYERRAQMTPTDIANENRRIIEMQAEKLRSMQEGMGS